MSKLVSFFKGFGVFGIIAGFITIILTPLVGWVTHIVYCFQNNEYILLLVGAIVAPIGSIHGIGLWFGVW